MVGGWADAAGQPSGTVMRHIGERSEKEGWFVSKKARCAHACTHGISQGFHQVQLAPAYYLSIHPLIFFSRHHLPYPSGHTLFLLSFLHFSSCPSTFSSSQISPSPFLSQTFLISHLCRSSPPPLYFTSGALVRAVSPRRAPRARKHPPVTPRYQKK